MKKEKKSKKVVKKAKENIKYNQLRIELGALATGMFYSAQQERIDALNRIRQVIYRRIEGKSLTDKSKKIEDKNKSRGKLNDRELIKYIIANKVKLTNEEAEYVDMLIELFNEIKQKENEYKSLMHIYIELEPIYNSWLKDVKGVSTIITANLLQYFGYCEKAKHCSSLWKYCGLHVVNGKAPKKEKGKDGESGQLDWNPKLRALMYRIGDSFVKQRTKPYREIYEVEKAKQLKLGGWDIKKKVMKKIKNPGAPQRLLHAELRARRKMVKMFLQDYYNHCLLLRGIEPEPNYSARFHPNEKAK